MRSRAALCSALALAWAVHAAHAAPEVPDIDRRAERLFRQCLADRAAAIPTSTSPRTETWRSALRFEACGLEMAALHVGDLEHAERARAAAVAAGVARAMPIVATPAAEAGNGDAVPWIVLVGSVMFVVGCAVGAAAGGS